MPHRHQRPSLSELYCGLNGYGIFNGSNDGMSIPYRSAAAPPLDAGPPPNFHPSQPSLTLSQQHSYTQTHALNPGSSAMGDVHHYGAPPSYAPNLAPSTPHQSATAHANSLPGTLQPGLTPQRPPGHQTLPQISTQLHPLQQPHQPQSSLSARSTLSSAHTYSRSSPGNMMDTPHKYKPFSDTAELAKYTSASSSSYIPQTPQGPPSYSPLGLADIRPRAETGLSDVPFSPSTAAEPERVQLASTSSTIAPWPIYAVDWCKWRPRKAGSAGKIALGSYLEDNHNYIQVLDATVSQTTDEAGDRGLEFTKTAEATHAYPVTRILWEPPSSNKQSTDLLATSGDHLRLWSLPAESAAGYGANLNQKSAAQPLQKLSPLALLSNSKSPEHTAPITSLDWNVVQPSLIITSSIDTTCTIWDIPTLTAKTQLIAHDKEVYDVRFCANSVDVFVSCGADGSVRMFDLRSLEHSTIIYEPSEKTEKSGSLASSPPSASPTRGGQAASALSYPPPLLRIAASPFDAHLLATFSSDSNLIRVLDVRQPGQALLELRGHGASVNCIEWSTTQRGVLASGADDCLVLLWDLVNSTAAAPSSTISATGSQAAASGPASAVAGPGSAQERRPSAVWECGYEVSNLSWAPSWAGGQQSNGGISTLGTMATIASPLPLSIEPGLGRVYTQVKSSSSSSMDHGGRTAPSLLRHCLLHRVSPDQVVHLLLQKKEQELKAAGSRTSLLRTLLHARQCVCAPGDPLPPRYLEALLLAQVVSFSDALVVLIARWNAALPRRVPASDINSLQEITIALLSPRLVLSATETGQCLLLSSRWLIAIARCINNDPNGVDTSVNQLSEACAGLLATLSATSPGIALLSETKSLENGKDKAAKIIDAVGHAVELAISLFPAISAQLMERLGVIQKHIALLSQSADQADASHHPDLQALHFQAGIPEPQMVGSRAATVLYLEAMLFTGKTIDHTTLFNFLEGRHCQNYHAIFLDLLFASFYILNKSSGLGQPLFDHTQLFIRNKLPLLLSSIASNPFATFTPEQVMLEVWPDLSSGLVSAADLQPCLGRFLHVCTLTGVITEAKRDELVHDSAAIAAMSKTLQTKDDVVAQVNNGHTRPTQLVNLLTQTDGSAAAVAQAIVEIILTYCQNKETHHLRDLAHAIIRKPEAVNALSLFIRPSYWLSPLCSLLDEWRWDEIQGESQPLYDEFGAILLLLLLARTRLSLTKSDMGITNSTGFVSRYLDHQGTEMALPDLSQQCQNHLGEWINALYVLESLNDELTTSCSPQDFYLFLPTLLRQSLLALQCSKLSADSLKGGLEFLLEPFLLPSLVSAMSWIHACANPAAASSILPILTKSPENADARSIHQTIMSMTRQDSLAHFAFQRPAASASVATFSSQIASAILSNIGTEANLAANFDGLIQNCGVDLALRTLFDILIRFSGTEHFLTSLDLCSTLVCVVDPQIRDLLKLKAATIGPLLKKSQALLAEAVVHLHRRVEAYASVLMVQDLGIDQFATLQLSNIEVVAADMDVQAAATQDVQPSVDQSMDDIDQVLNESAALTNLDPSDASGLNIDDFYGLQNEMGNLDDLDLEMFS
ncbi:hypothetical protein DV735_g5771, partial [Chaetothyriales sp. CBS 134920]